LTRSALRCVLVGFLLLVSTEVRPAPADTGGSSLSADIAAQPLSGALAAFADQTGLQLVYVSTLVEGRTSPGVTAGLSPSAALGRLLAGTGLDFVFLNSRTVKIFAKPKVTPTPPSSAQSQRREVRSSVATGPDEVVVTATKREERVNAVPVSLSVLSAEQMLEAGVTNIAAIAALTPGVEYDFNSQWGSGVLTNVAIRGVDSKVGTSTTGIYLDDAPIQARNGNFGNPYPVTFDLARVEVLRGPQGTLFGAGAEGGAIRYVTNEPSMTDFGGFSRAQIATTANGSPSYELGSALGGPIVEDHVGVRLAAWYREDGGYVDHVDPFTSATISKNSNTNRTEFVRLGLAFEPFESLRVTPSVTYQSNRTADSPAFYQYLSNPGSGEFLNGKLLAQPADDSFTVAALKIETQLPQSKLTAATSYLDRTAHATVDTTNEAGAVYFGGFGNPLGPEYPTSYADATPSLMTLRQIVLSQEVRLASSVATAPLRWSAGLFYSRAEQDELEYTYAIAAPADPGVVLNEYTADTIVSGFGNIELAFLQSLRTRIGVRVDDTRSVFSQYSGGFALAGSPPYAYAVTEFRPVTPQFNLEYQASQRDLIYATIAKGFRIGGINTPLPSQCGAGSVPSSYAPDSVWSYEVGTKSEFLQDRLRIAASAFYLRWNGIQEHEVPPCGFGFIANAGNAIGKGLDFALDGTLTDSITLGVAFESLDVRYTQTVMEDGKIIVDRGAVVGGVPHVPSPWSGTAFIRYQQPISGELDLFARADDIFHSHNPGPFSELDPRSISYSPLFTADPAFNQLNLKLGVSSPRSELKLFVDNATNSRPLLQRGADSGTSTLIYAYTLRPRTWGLALNWKF
jgi:iron complex outermembrane recepter protein